LTRGAPAFAATASTLAQFFKFGVHCAAIETSPVQLLYRPGGPERPRDRLLSDTGVRTLLRERKRIFARAPRTAATVRLALMTACRRGEFTQAKWQDIDLSRKTPTWRIPAENSKNASECINPLVQEAVDEFKSLKEYGGRSSWAFPADAGEGPLDPKLLTRSIARHLVLLKDAGVAPFTLHDLRRTVRTGLARLRVPPHIAEAVLNHRAAGIIAVYDRYSYVDEKREALTKWAAHLATLDAA